MKIPTLAAIVVLSLFITSCSSSGDGRVTDRFNPRTGSQGLVFDFLDNAPPKEVYEETTVPVSIEIENKGAYDVIEGYLSWNVPSGLFDSDDPDLDFFEIYGKNVNNPQGEILNLYHYLDTKALPPQQEVHTANLGVSLCYDYETLFSEEVCIDTSILRKSNFEKPCTVQDISSSGQGAPVVITKVETAMIPMGDDRVNPRFTIHIKNSGSGKVINRHEVHSACTSEFVEGLYNIIYVDDARLSKSYNLDCTGLKRNIQLGRSYIALDEKEDTTFVCEFKSGLTKDLGTFLTPLILKLSYGYMETKSAQLDIRSSRVI